MMQRTAFVILTCALMSAGAMAQDPGRVWFELPPGPGSIGQPYEVAVHVATGSQEPDTIQVSIEYDDNVLDLALSEASGFPPVFTNPDLELGETLVNAAIDDLQLNHASDMPGVIRACRAGGTNNPWAVSGNVELFRITFMPQSAGTTTLEGTVTVLKDAELHDIGDPQEVLDAQVQISAGGEGEGEGEGEGAGNGGHGGRRRGCSAGIVDNASFPGISLPDILASTAVFVFLLAVTRSTNKSAGEIMSDASGRQSAS